MPEDALTFVDLQTHIASQLGVAYYGADGTGVAQAPTDTYTLDAVKDYVNGGIRMFLNDAPREGWRFQQPVASITLWATTTGVANGAPSFGDPESTVLANVSMFHASMVGHKLKFTVTSTADGTPTYDSTALNTTVDVDDTIFKSSMVGQSIMFSATGTSYVINKFTDSTTVIVDGDASDEADGDTVTATHDYVIETYNSIVSIDVTGDASGEADNAARTVTADGSCTLPGTFGGEYLGPITFAAGTNLGVTPTWGSEGVIRLLQANSGTTTGSPTLAAVRKRDATNVARVWELAVYPTPGIDYTIEFPYELYFTALSAATDLHPAGAHYDEAIMAACEAYAEMKGQDALQGRVQYYENKALPAAQRRNARSAPRRLGSLLPRRRRYIGNIRNYYERPDVTVG